MGYPFHIYKLLFICPRSKWRAEQMVPQVWLIRYRRIVCFRFYIRFFFVSCPWFLHFDSIAFCLNPPTTAPLALPLPHCLPLRLYLWQNPVVEGVCVCVSVSVCWEWGGRVHLGVSFAAMSHPCQHVSSGQPWLTGRGGCGSAACCHMRESAYIQCLWIKTGKYRHKKFKECLLRGVVCWPL